MREPATVVIGGLAGIGGGLAQELSGRGHLVGVVDPTVVDLTDPDVVGGVLRELATSASLRTVVLAHLEPSAFTGRPLVDLDEDEWETAAERSLRAAFVVLQQAHAVVPDGARVVVVLPTVAVNGAPGLVALCTAVEGIRVMAKAVARRWGGRGLTLNTIEVDLAAFVGGDGSGAPPATQLGPPALAPGSAAADVADLVEMLRGPAGGVLTGALLVADRGMVMLP